MAADVVAFASPGPTFIKPDQRDPWIKDQIKITLLAAEHFLVDPWSTDQADLVW